MYNLSIFSPSLSSSDIYVLSIQFLTNFTDDLNSFLSLSETFNEFFVRESKKLFDVSSKSSLTFYNSNFFFLRILSPYTLKK